MAKLTAEQQVDIINRYRHNLATVVDMATEYGVSRQAIYRFLGRVGVTTDKGPVLVTCNACYKDILRTKARIRKNRRNFCNHACYQAYLQAAGGLSRYLPSTQGGRIARTVVSEFFQLLPGHVVHHKDRNSLNNELFNLMVFRNQGDHTRWHRGLRVEVEPLWDGEYPHRKIYLTP
jgi:hypothetical protein